MDCEVRQQVEEINEMLAGVSDYIYGGRAELRIVGLKDLRHLSKNARFFQRERFEQLVDNVRSDGMLESIPLCWENENEEILVISGNHRVQAARKAGLTEIPILLLKGNIAEGRRIAKQLAHNALVGSDDLEILAELWNEMEDLADKLYAGLDSEIVDEIESIEFKGYTPEPIRMEEIVIWFLPSELARLEEALKQSCLADSAKGTVFTARAEDYDRVWKMLVEVKKRDNIKNTAVAFNRLVDFAEIGFQTLQNSLE